MVRCSVLILVRFWLVGVIVGGRKWCSLCSVWVRVCMCSFLCLLVFCCGLLMVLGCVCVGVVGVVFVVWVVWVVWVGGVGCGWLWVLL